MRPRKQCYGKGSTKARAHVANDRVTIVLERGFTRAEQTLLEHGHSDEVARSRAAIEAAVDHERARDQNHRILAEHRALRAEQVQSGGAGRLETRSESLPR